MNTLYVRYVYLYTTSSHGDVEWSAVGCYLFEEQTRVSNAAEIFFKVQARV